MKLRFALLVMIAAALEIAPLGPKKMVAAAIGEGSGTAVSPSLPWHIFYRTAPGAALGNPCCVRSDGVWQGQNGDCFLMSSLAAVASVSPETIRKGIKDNGDGTYTVTLYKEAKGAEEDPAGPLVPVNYTVSGTFPSTSFWPFAPQFLYAQPNLVDGALWPMIYEKAYAATLEDGYNTYAMGGNGFWTMRAITGTPGDYWYLDPKETPGPVLESVWVHEVPAVPDVGAHSIIGGLLHGDLKAVEPNVQLCVSSLTIPKNRVCTAICRESYACKQPLGQRGLTLDAQHPGVHVEVLDIPRPGEHTVIAEFDQKDPSACPATQPCRQQVDAGLVTISFDVKAQSQQAFVAHTIATRAQLISLLTKLNGKAVTLSSLPLCDPSNPPATGRCARANDALFASKTVIAQHEYSFRSYNPATGLATVVNPWFPRVPIQISIANFAQAFQGIYSSDVKGTPGGCGCH